MRREEEARYTKIGAFVLAGIILLIGLILALSGGRFFQQKIYAETYFSESVQGLSIGSPVKFRGILIGKVTRITLLGNMYDVKNNNGYARDIYVGFEIDPDFTEKVRSHEWKPFIAREVKDGLRAKLALQDLTGNAYLALNFSDPKANPSMKITWKPNSIYIPSAPSLLTKFTDNVQHILANLGKVDFEAFFGNISDLASTSNETMNRVDQILSATQSSVLSTATNMQSLSNNLRQLSNKLSQNPSSILFDKPQEIDPSKL